MRMMTHTCAIRPFALVLKSSILGACVQTFKIVIFTRRSRFVKLLKNSLCLSVAVYVVQLRAKQLNALTGVLHDKMTVAQLVKFPRVLRNTNVNYCLHKILPLAPFLDYVNVFHVLTFSLILSSHLLLPRYLLPSCVSTKILSLFPLGVSCAPPISFLIL